MPTPTLSDLSPDQALALCTINAWLSSPTAPILTLGGYAGTGKTTLIAALCAQHPDLTIGIVSLTGKAISVLRSKLSAPNCIISTIHSLIYEPIIDPTTRAIIGWRKRAMSGTPAADYEERPIPALDLIINDEASMTSQDLYDDLLSYSVPILFVGDHGQLPPVSGSLNLMASPQIRLEQIHRQAADNPIIKLATLARTQNYLPLQELSPTVRVMSLQDGPGQELGEKMFSGSPDVLILTSTNKRRVGLNKRVLAALGHDQAARPFPSARLICLRNSPILGLYNGMQATLQKIRREDYASWNVDLLPDQSSTINADMSLDAFHQEKPDLSKIRRTTIPFDYGYALTCHKAQGSEARCVFIVGQGFGDSEERRRWMYTAITRAQEELYILL
jgi:exodeoxyribonuclease-5